MEVVVRMAVAGILPRVVGERVERILGVLEEKIERTLD